jgi:hypothetical protein
METEGEKPLMVRQASSHGSDLLDKFRNDGLDAWIIIQHLATTT